MSQADDGQPSAAKEQAGSEQDAETKAEQPKENDAKQAEKWLSGFRLVAVITSITLACFLMLLDLAIISTVRFLTG